MARAICLLAVSTRAWNLGDAPTEMTATWYSTFTAVSEKLIPRHNASIMNFQPAMSQPTNAAASGCPHSEGSLSSI